MIFFENTKELCAEGGSFTKNLNDPELIPLSNNMFKLGFLKYSTAVSLNGKLKVYDNTGQLLGTFLIIQLPAPEEQGGLLVSKNIILEKLPNG